MIDWAHFTPWASLAGGLVLGVAAAAFILLNGRILGISGILGGLLQPRLGDVLWRLVFLAGMVVAPWLLVALAPSAWLSAPRIEASWGTVVVAGLLVGAGTRYASGCTSGHGVCGLSRLSTRSLAATASFMGAGFLIVYLMRHTLGG
jgi:uncharacterized membrane protein YedE/YeeE